MKINEDVAVTFITRNLSERGLTEFLGDEQFRTFFELAGDGKDIAAAAEYQKLTGATLPECHLAVAVATQPNEK